jgi:hypothetical protein
LTLWVKKQGWEAEEEEKAKFSQPYYDALSVNAAKGLCNLYACCRKDVHLLKK